MKSLSYSLDAKAKGDVLTSFQLLVQGGLGLLFDWCPNFPLQNREMPRHLSFPSFSCLQPNSLHLVQKKARKMMVPTKKKIITEPG